MSFPARRFFCLSLVISTAMVFPCRAQERTTRSFGEGIGGADVGLAVDAGDDADVEGPQAIYSDDKGQLYLLDQLNGRILKFDPDHPDAPTQSLQLPAGMTPTDMILSDGKIRVWDGGVVTLQSSGAEDSPTRGLTINRSAGPPDEATQSAFAAMGSVDPDAEDQQTRSLGPAARREQFVASNGRGAVAARFTPIDGEFGVRIVVTPRGGGGPLARLDLIVSDRLGAAELMDIDRRGRFYVFAENIATQGDTANDFVARFSPEARLEGVYDLPLAQSTGVSRRFVAVTPEGDVYFLRNRNGSSSVLGVGFRPIAKGKVIGFERDGVQFDLGGFPKLRAGHVAVRPLTREQVIRTGMEFANVHWKVTPSAYGSDPDMACSGFNRVRRPGYLHGRLNQTVVGIPYCWGCQGNLAQIADELRKGERAGNVCTRNDPRPGLVGVDCSAFVSAAWGLSTHFTTIAIPSIARNLSSGWDLLPGDALDKPGSHVMLFVRFTRDKKAEVLESSTGGCNGKVCRNVYPLGSLLARGYRPMRYRGLLSDASTSTEAAGMGADTPQGRTKGRQGH